MLVACVATVLSSACTAPSNVTHQQSAITGGDLTSDHPAALRLQYHSAGGGEITVCSGSLVGKRTVLTAAHCTNWLRDPEPLHVLLDSGESVPVEEVHYFPAYTPLPACSEDLPKDSRELAVLRLAHAPAATPAALATSSIEVGLPITLVGFGHTECWSVVAGDEPAGDDIVCAPMSCDGVKSSRCCKADNDVKRSGETIVSKVTTAGFRFDGKPSTCFYDSGGPTFAQVEGHPVQVGVHSLIGFPCGTWGEDIRVDALVSWIAEVAGGDVNMGVDEEPPRLAFVGLGDGDVIAPGEHQVELSVSDDADPAPEVTLWLDETLVSRTIGPPLFTVELQAGQRLLEARARDAAGREARALISVRAGIPAEDAGVDAGVRSDGGAASDSHPTDAAASDAQADTETDDLGGRGCNLAAARDATPSSRSLLILALIAGACVLLALRGGSGSRATR